MYFRQISWILLFITFASAHAQTQQTNDGNTAYEAGDINRAIEAFEEHLVHEGHSYASYYNLGTAYAASGQIGEAILAYERASLIKKTEDLEFNLKAVSDQIENTIPAFSEFFVVRYWKIFNGLLSPNMWAILSLSLGVLLLFLLIQKWLKDIDLGFALPLTITFFFLALILTYSSKGLSQSQLFGVLLEEESLYEGSDVRSGTIRKVSEGVKVKVISELDGWYRVQLPDNELGWLEEDNLGLIQL